jgi:protein transport protein SEC13
MYNYLMYDRHDGPVWQLAWAHPMYGSILATCGYDRKVIMWKESDDGWQKIYEYTNHDSSGMMASVCLKTEILQLNC